MSDFPQPDLMDQGGRLRRLALALLIGAAAGAVAYFIADSLAKPDARLSEHQPSRGAFRFVFYMTAFAGAVAFGVALAVQNKIADKKYRDSLVAKAQVRRE